MAAPVSVTMSRHFIEGSIAGRANLQYFDPSRNDMRFSPGQWRILRHAIVLLPCVGSLDRPLQMEC